LDFGFGVAVTGQGVLRESLRPLGKLDSERTASPHGERSVGYQVGLVFEAVVGVDIFSGVEQWELFGGFGYAGLEDVSKYQNNCDKVRELSHFLCL
jgi:hypothetical protein